MDGATVAGDETSGLIESRGRYVTAVDGQAQAVGHGTAPARARGQHVVTQATAAACRGQAKIDNLPDVTAWNLCHEEHRRGFWFAGDASQSAIAPPRTGRRRDGSP